MIPGFNETLRHQGRNYHVQTEDLGIGKALVVSQIFCDGQILHTERTDYRPRLEEPDLERELKKLLLRQHRNMHRLIARGEFPQVRRRESLSEIALAAGEGPERGVGEGAPGRPGPDPRGATLSELHDQATPVEGSLIPALGLPGPGTEPARSAAPAASAPAPSPAPETGFLARYRRGQRLDLLLVLELARRAEGPGQPQSGAA